VRTNAVAIEPVIASERLTQSRPQKCAEPSGLDGFWRFKHVETLNLSVDHARSARTVVQCHLHVHVLHEKPLQRVGTG